MTSPTPTIIDLKTAFLRSQILLLSQPLRHSASFQSTVSSEENTLRQKAIDDTLYKLNALLKKHNKLSYGPQAQRHVAEQVDRLYWNAGERGVVVGEEWAERGADYRKDDIINKLPEEWSLEASSKAPEQAARYTELQSKLVDLAATRRAARERLAQYKAAKDLLAPFENADTVVQENLVTRNGEVEQELERMRMLMLRVERGIVGLPERREEGRDMDVDIDGDSDDGGKKVLALLSG